MVVEPYGRFWSSPPWGILEVKKIVEHLVKSCLLFPQNGATHRVIIEIKTIEFNFIHLHCLATLLHLVTVAKKQAHLNYNFH